MRIYVFVHMYACTHVCMYLLLYVCVYVCLNRAGSDGQLFYAKLFEHHAKDVDIREKIAAVFIERCTGW
jgi:hypothetical protein